jgi:hypothetical protein
MTPPKGTSKKSNRKQGGKDQLQKLHNEARKLVPEYDEIDVQTTTLYRRESPRGTVVRILTWSSVGLLTLIGLYGMITHDREILLATLKAVQLTMGAVAAGILGKTVTRLLTRGSNKDEENEDSG